MDMLRLPGFRFSLGTSENNNSQHRSFVIAALHNGVDGNIDTLSISNITTLALVTTPGRRACKGKTTN